MRASAFRRRAFAEACARAGLPVPELDEDGKRIGREVEPPHVHDLRHARATLLFQARASPREVMEQLGHTDPRLALRINAGVLDEMKLRTADAMGELMQAASADEGKVIALPTMN